MVVLKYIYLYIIVFTLNCRSHDKICFRMTYVCLSLCGNGLVVRGGENTSQNASSSL